jgi:predicted pyridoxine 5'-phosphate oxidase superfamily flavin-nucleotide-binding protein
MFHLPGSRYGFYTLPYQNTLTKGAHVFSEEELEYLTSQPLLRLATVDANGQPTVDAVGYEFEEGRFYTNRSRRESML